MPNFVLEARNVRKQYGQLPVLRGVDFALEAGELVALVGKSGAGKSTLLHILGTLDRPDAGEVWFEGQRIDRLGGGELARLRNHRMGFVFQFHHLLPEFTALENVMMPGLIAGGRPGKLQPRAQELLTTVGLEHRLHHRPGQLSGGEQQRVAVARALMNAPVVILADEPTGNLDSANRTTLVELFGHLCARHGVSWVVATHDEEIAQAAHRVIRIEDGLIPAPNSPALLAS